MTCYIIVIEDDNDGHPLLSRYHIQLTKSEGSQHRGERPSQYSKTSRFFP